MGESVGGAKNGELVVGVTGTAGVAGLFKVPRSCAFCCALPVYPVMPFAAASLARDAKSLAFPDEVRKSTMLVPWYAIIYKVTVRFGFKIPRSSPSSMTMSVFGELQASTNCLIRPLAGRPNSPNDPCD